MADNAPPHHIAPSSSDPLPPKAALIQEEHAKEQAAATKSAPAPQKQDDAPIETHDIDHYQAAPGVPATGAKDLIDVPVHVDSLDLSSSESEEDTSGVKKAASKVTGVLGKAKRLRGDKKTTIGKVKVLKMTREEYKKYWAKDDDGNYCGTEPEGEGRRLWADQLKGD